MRKLILFVIFALVVLPAWAVLPIGIVINSVAANSVSSRTLSVTSGKLLIVVKQWESGTSGGTVTDTCGSTWPATPLHIQNASGPDDLFLWYATAACTNSADVVSISGSVGSFQQMSVQQFDRYTATTDGSHTDTSNPGAAGTFTGGSFSTSANGDLVICAVGGDHSNSSFAPADNAFSSSTQNGNDSQMVSFYVAGAAGSQTCAVKNSRADILEMISVAFKPASGITITSAALPDGATSAAYSYQLQAVGGSGAYTWSITSGSLFSGLSLSSGGAITGTATTGGTNSITFSVTDGTNTQTATLSLTIGATLSTPAFVQIKDTTATTGASLAFTSNVTAGNLVLGIGETNVGNAWFKPSCVTDTRGTTFSMIAVVSFVETTASQNSLGIVVAGIAPSTGADTLVFTNCNVGAVAVIEEISGLQLSTDVGAITGNVSTTPTSVSLTTLVPNQFIYALGMSYNSGPTIAATSPLSTDSGSQSISGAGAWNLAHEAAATATGYSPAFSVSGTATTGWFVNAMAFRPSIATAFAATGVRHRSQVF